MTKQEISKIAEQVLKLNQEAKEIETKLKSLKEDLKKAGSGQYGNFVVAITEAERESFQLKEAQKELTPSVWDKIKGFIKTTSYETVRVTEIKG